MTSWRRSSPKLRSARDEIRGRCAEAKSSSGTALPRLRNCPRTRTHFDGATKSGWHSNSANDAEPFYPKSIDPAHHLLAIRHLACGFPGSVSQKLTHQLSAFSFCPPTSVLFRHSMLGVGRFLRLRLPSFLDPPPNSRLPLISHLNFSGFQTSCRAGSSRRSFSEDGSLSTRRLVTPKPSA